MKYYLFAIPTVIAEKDWPEWSPGTDGIFIVREEDSENLDQVQAMGQLKQEAKYDGFDIGWSYAGDTEEDHPWLVTQWEQWLLAKNRYENDFGDHWKVRFDTWVS